MDCLRKSSQASLADPNAPVAVAGACAKILPDSVLTMTPAATVASEPRMKCRRSNLPGETSISFSDSIDMERSMSDIGFRMVRFLRNGMNVKSFHEQLSTIDWRCAPARISQL